MGMIAVDIDSTRFNYRVAAICARDGYVLLAQAEGYAFWFLPGGRCEIAEPSMATLRREMREELGLQVEVGRLLWVVENFFTFDGRPHHEIALCYAIALPVGCAMADPTYTHRVQDGGASITFAWHAIGRLDDLDLRPTFLRRALRELLEHTGHIIHVDA